MLKLKDVKMTESASLVIKSPNALGKGGQEKKSEGIKGQSSYHKNIVAKGAVKRVQLESEFSLADPKISTNGAAVIGIETVDST